MVWIAGQPVDSVIDELTPLLDQGDIIMDGGNSEQSDTTRRYRRLHHMGLHFMGIGVSGGEEGARHGPSIMYDLQNVYALSLWTTWTNGFYRPGGSLEGWLNTKDILQVRAEIYSKIEKKLKYNYWLYCQSALLNLSSHNCFRQYRLKLTENHGIVLYVK